MKSDHGHLGSRRATRTLAALSAALLIVGVGLLAACSSEASYDTSVQGMPADDTSVQGMLAEADEVATSVDRQIIATAYMSIRVDDVTAASARITALVATNDGLIEQQDISNTDGDFYASITARVPADRFDSFVDRVSEIGTVESLSSQVADVTQQTVDLDARTGALTTSVERLKELLAQTTNVADLVAVETELAYRQAELDSLLAQRSYLSDQVAMSTITISLSQAVWAEDFLLPIVAVTALIVLIIVIATTRARRRRTAQHLPPSEVTEPTSPQ